MIEFIKMTCRKNSEQKNQNRTKNKMLQVGVLFIFGYAYKTSFQTEQYRLYWNFISSDSEDK